MTEDECRTLAASVQRNLDVLHDESGEGPWAFELGPSAADYAPVFIDLKREWDKRKLEIDTYQDSSSNSWMSEVHWLFSMAQENAEIIRNLRGGQTPTV